MDLQFIADDPWMLLWLSPAILFFAYLIFASRGIILAVFAIQFALALGLVFVGPRLVQLNDEFTRHPYEPDLIKWAIGLTALACVYLWAQRRWPSHMAPEGGKG
jgi:hypothetical protein